MKYNHKPIEGKWQKIWEDKGVFQAENNSEKEKFYQKIRANRIKKDDVGQKPSI